MSIATAQFLYGFFGMLAACGFAIGALGGFAWLGMNLLGTKIPWPMFCGMWSFVGVVGLAGIVLILMTLHA